MQCLNNLLLNTDSYKASHWLQYPPGTDATFFYVESRGGVHDRTVFFGLQAILKEYLPEPLTDEQLDALVGEGIAATGSATPRDLGKVMGWLAPRTRGRADGKVVSTKVAAALSAGERSG